MKNEEIFVLVFLAVFLSAAGAWLISKYGRHIGLLDKPNKRSSHNLATPKGGAVGILLAFFGVAIYLGIPPSFWLPAVFLAGLSFIGDRIDISPSWRLFFQFAASLIVLLGYWMAPSSPVLNGLLIIPLALFIVATANYYNFMDGINGIAGITGLIGFGLLAVFAHVKDADTNLKLLAICLSLSCLGFLPLNMPQARVFMGDIGSILLGFVFSVMVIYLSRSTLDFICLASFLFPFYADEITTELVRLKDGEKLWTPHRRHLYQIMANEYGIAHWKISTGYGMAQLIIGVSAIYMLQSGVYPLTLTILLYFTIFSLVSGAVRKRLIRHSEDDV
jgi:UDP-N-acetylmuramyl pentapeptide phosphotransferase/UDP-N-acetylglucosamine-1-phosphate transferase